MKITVSQQNLPTNRQEKKLLVIFQQNGNVDNYHLDKADDFLSVVDKFLKRRNNSLASVFNAGLDFISVSMLTERIIKAIITGLRF